MIVHVLNVKQQRIIFETACLLIPNLAPSSVWDLPITVLTRSVLWPV